MVLCLTFAWTGISHTMLIVLLKIILQRKVKLCNAILVAYCVPCRVLSGVKLLGGNLHICLYVRMYIHTCAVRHKHDVCVSRDIEITCTHACSMHIRFSFGIMMKMRQWQSIVMYVIGADMYVE